MEKSKWIVVGGIPIRMYTGTITFAGLICKGIFDQKYQAEKCVTDNYEDCGGLISMFEIKGDQNEG